MSIQALDYSQIYLVPQRGVLTSRSQADLTADLGRHTFKLPIAPSNMKGSISKEIAEWLSNNGYFYVMHRFGDTLEFVRAANIRKFPVVSISIGVKDVDRTLIDSIINQGLVVDFVTIDIAHGHSTSVCSMIQFIKNRYETVGLTKPFIIAGNVATSEGVTDLADMGADAVKIGIGGGGVCSTKNKTGFHIPMATCVACCASRPYGSKRVPLIADGGIRENGDIAKALALGADWVMAGGMFAACIDSPAENIYGPHSTDIGEGRPFYINGPIIGKRFFGSASAENKGANKHVEGLSVDLPCNNLTIAEKLEEIHQDLASSVSYAGGTMLHDLKFAKACRKA